MGATQYATHMCDRAPHLAAAGVSLHCDPESGTNQCKHKHTIWEMLNDEANFIRSEMSEAAV